MMIRHYLKIAVRNLWKYKVQSMISALCLAVGIVVFSLAYLFVDRMADAYSRLPEHERYVRIMAFTKETGGDMPFALADVDELLFRTEGILDSVSVHSATMRTDADVIGKDGSSLPYIIRYKVTNSSFFRYFNLPLLYGNFLPKSADEIVVSSEFAERIARGGSPIGMVVRLASFMPENGIRDYRIVNVADVPKDGLNLDADCYFPLELQPYAWLQVHAFIPEGQMLSGLDETLKRLAWDKEGKTVTVDASPVSGQTNTVIAKILALLLASLILVSGLITFLKFTFQMFYARQHELALRKSMGSDMKGVFCLLFVEVFCMLSFAFLLSQVLLEGLQLLVSRFPFLPEENMGWFVLEDCYLVQGGLYLAVLFICLFIVACPVWRVRRVNLVNRIRTNGRRHGFRCVMICIQLFVSMGFLGAVIIVRLSYDELGSRLYYPSEKVEENRIIAIDMTTAVIRNNWDAIHAEINRMPEIEGQTSLNEDSDDGMLSYRFITFMKQDSTEVSLKVMTGNPNYFSFFHIPLQGKALETETEGFVYVSRSVAELMRHEHVKGMIRLDGKAYQIAGVYEELYKNVTGNSRIAGSVFFPAQDFKTWLLKVASGQDADKVMGKVKAVCRKHVPYTLPLDVYKFGSRSVYSMMDTLEAVMWILAAVSLMLVILSMYSSISMDAVTRRKEVAIRKINGASYRDIAMLFAKSYITMFLLMYLLVYPLLKLAMANLLEGSSLKSVYGWEWGVILFAVMALLTAMAIGWQIIKLMRINPADTIKKE